MDANNPVVTDSEILEAIRQKEMTYVIANRINLKVRGSTIPTDYIRRRLEKLESAGLVKRVPSVYSKQICWQLTEVGNE